MDKMQFNEMETKFTLIIMALVSNGDIGRFSLVDNGHK